MIPLAIFVGVGVALLQRGGGQGDNGPVAAQTPPRLTNAPPVQMVTNQAREDLPMGQGGLSGTNAAVNWRRAQGVTYRTNLVRNTATNSPIVLPRTNTPSAFVPRTVKTDLELQLALDRRGYSPGSIDGVSGPQTRAAIQAFQQQERLPLSGQMDDATRDRLLLRGPVWTEYVMTAQDLAGIQPLGKTWTEKSRQNRLGHESALEWLAERFHCSPRFLRRNNPRVDWNRVTEGQVVKVPNVALTPLTGEAALVHIQLRARSLRVYDSSTNLMAHFPCSIATHVAARPVGELQIVMVVPRPNYTFDPARFPGTPEAQNGDGKLVLSPGPNNPVGTVWLELDRPGYGIHGTPDPEKVGRTTSLGCFRLANWNAERLLRVVQKGTRVLVEP